MPLWTPKATLELVTLIRKDNAHRPKTMEDLVKAFHKCQPYNGVCQGCCINPWTLERVRRKVRRLVTEADALAEENKKPKGSLIEPPKAPKKKSSSNKQHDTNSKEEKVPSTLEEMLKMKLPAKETAKKTTRKGPERRSTKKTLESVAHSAAVKSGKATERRKKT